MYSPVTPAPATPPAPPAPSAPPYLQSQLLAQVLQQMRTQPQTPIGGAANMLAGALDAYGQQAAGQGGAGQWRNPVTHANSANWFNSPLGQKLGGLFGLGQAAQAQPTASPQPAAADPRTQELAAALASLHGQAKTIRTPTALASDLLAEALLQRRYRQALRNGIGPAQAAPIPEDPAPGRAQAPGGAPAYAPQGRPGPLQVASVPEAAPLPSPPPCVPAPSAPAGVVRAAPAAISPAAGAAMAAAYTQGDPRQHLATPGPGFAPSPGALANARAAIRRGADPVRVAARLAAHGYDPRAL